MTEKQLYKDWEIFRINLLKETPLEPESHEEKIKRIAHLKKPGNHEEFFKYYFPNYSYAEPAPFHKRASKRIIENDEWYEVRPWSRELAKSARTMMEFLYLVLTGKLKNIILISATNKSAVNLLTPFRINLEINQRIINDFGDQRGFKWEENHFVTRNNVSFFAFGAGEAPRGTRNEEIRPDGIIFDDIDTDEEVRNPERIQKKWDWIEQAVMPTVSVSKSKRIVFCGNIIGKDTCITRAMEFADFYEIVNIRDKNGVSTWSKNSEAAIDRILSKMSYRSAQKEYFNNPITQGTVFKEIVWGKVPTITAFKFLVKYGDPSYSNKINKKNSQKCVAKIGKVGNKYYILDCRLDRVKNSDFVTWYWELDQDKKESVQHYNYIENNSLQDPFFTQVIKPEFESQSLKADYPINPFSDDRKKPEKFSRIEGNLEPLNRDGKLIFNDKEKDNPHMKRLAEQFLLFSEQNISDGPDAVEGGIWVIDHKLKIIGEIKTKPISTKTRRNRY